MSWLLLLGLGFPAAEAAPAKGPRIFLVQKAITILVQKDGYRARVVLRNRGDLPAVTGEYVCLLKKEGELVLQQKQTVAPVEPGERKEFFCDLGKLGVGAYELLVEGRYDGQVTRVEKEFIVPGVNLKVLAPWIMVHPLNPLPETPFTVRVGVLNNGTLTARNVFLQIQIWQDGQQVGLPIPAEPFDLEPGARRTVLFRVPGLPPGRYEIRAVVDRFDEIPEIREKDNIATRQLGIRKKFLLR